MNNRAAGFPLVAYAGTFLGTEYLMEPLFSSAVLWTAGIFGFLGFMLGSIAPNDPEATVKWDMQGSLIWMIAGAAGAGGVAMWMTTGAATPGLYGFGFALLMIVLRVAGTRPPRVPVGKNLESGIHRAQGETRKARMKQAERMYYGASFSQGSYYATRAPLEYRYGSKGASADDLALLRDAARSPSSNRFAILVVLVRELPNEPEQPAVVVVRSPDELRALSIESDGITVPGQPKIPASTIAGMVGYAWR